MTDMPNFQKTVYSKSSDGAVYTFPVEWSENEPKWQWVAHEPSEATYEELLKQLNLSDQWDNFMLSFMEHSKKMFAKAYTISHLHKITKHKLEKLNVSCPVTLTLFPKQIQIVSGILWVYWHVNMEVLCINIPEQDDKEQDDKEPELEEYEVNELPVGTDDTLELDDPTKLYEKQKVKEIRLKAKLAAYRAQYQLERYYEKYGEEISESETESGTESESESEN
jgi:hypothetical protein